ncbi:hypothetical protein CIG19_18825 [Enterobacterales bacterium CwR94]|nr:hypothetical protein CIG19_18825 [Enterobacterales bacterium CwR94]
MGSVDSNWDAHDKAAQLTELLCLIHDHGCSGVKANSELIGLAYNLSAEILLWAAEKDKEDEPAN